MRPPFEVVQSAAHGRTPEPHGGSSIQGKVLLRGQVAPPGRGETGLPSVRQSHSDLSCFGSGRVMSAFLLDQCDCSTGPGGPGTQVTEGAALGTPSAALFLPLLDGIGCGRHSVLLGAPRWGSWRSEIAPRLYDHPGRLPPFRCIMSQADGSILHPDQSSWICGLGQSE